MGHAAFGAGALLRISTPDVHHVDHHDGGNDDSFCRSRGLNLRNDGWVAATTPVTIPWEMTTKTPPDVISGYNWELYNIENDFTEFDDLATKMPAKLKEMQDIFYAEAKTFDVLPLDNSTLARFLTPRPSATAGRTTFTYSGELTGVPASAAPSILQKSYTITAEVEIPEGDAEGMIVTRVDASAATACS
jgi:hypothetical protein